MSWDKEPPPKSSSGWDAEPPPKAKASGALVGVRNAVQGASAGFSDEVAGGVEAVGKALGFDGAGGAVKDIKRSEQGMTTDWEVLKHAYITGRNRERDALKQDMKDSPALATTANIAGSIVSPVNKIMPNASLAKSGAAIGAVTGLGTSDATNVKDLVVDTATGTVVGAAVGKGIEKVSPLIEKGVKAVGEKSKDLAEKFAARALGAERGTINKFGQKEVQKAGRYALDEGIVTVGNNTEQKIAANEAAKKSAMDARKGAYESIDNNRLDGSINPLEVATKAEQKILGGKNRAHEDVQELAAAVDPHLSNILSRGEGNITLTEAQELLNGLQKKARFDSSRSNTQNEVAKDIYHTVRKAINEAAETGAEVVGIPGLREVIESSNAKYATGKTASALLKNKLAREQGNNIVGLTDVIAGTGAVGYGSTTGDWEGAGAAMLAKRGLQRFGPQATAKALDAVSKKLLGVPQMAELAKKSPALFQVIAPKFERGASGVRPAAENEGPAPRLKGQDKWVADGFAKLDKQNALSDDPEMVAKMLTSKDGRKLLIAASDLKPGTKAMDSVVAKINAKFKKGN